ncbi:MAG: phenylalanine--tRNA ligase subunit alpha, partial [Planctomycetes bacterium]|nr:phenylalanine--tRNA ligase subunit alpha [Planctomycetota bacterium]
MGLLEELEALEAQAKADIAAAGDAGALEQFRIRYLGAKGAVKDAMNRLKEVPREEKPAAGKRANEVKNAIQALYDGARASVGAAGKAVKSVTDVTLP